MSRKIIGVTVGTPLSPSKIEDKIKPIKTVNGVEPDENGNVEVIGNNGENGNSAYEIALGNGFEGTEEEWLESLKGADGASASIYMAQTPQEDGTFAFEQGKKYKIYAPSENGKFTCTINLIKEEFREGGISVHSNYALVTNIPCYKSCCQSYKNNNMFPY